MEQTIYDVIIIGGGIVGTSIAREISKHQISACLLEKNAEVSFGVTKANSGIVHAGFDSPPSTLKGKLCAKGNHLYSVLKEELDIPFKQIGEIVIAFNDEDTRTLAELKEFGDENGVPNLRIITKDELLKLEPNASTDAVSALYAPSAGVTNPYELTYILAENAIANGVDIRCSEEAIAIITDDSENKLKVITTKGTLSCRYIINAGGLFADRIANMAGIYDFKICPRKGEEYLLDRKCEGLIKQIIFPVPNKKSKGTLVIPTLDGTIMVGPSAIETSNREDLATSNEVFADIFAKAKKMIPAINPRNLISAFAGIRPASDTGDFIIGKTAVKGFINVAGIQSPGLTAAPAIAEMVVDILRNDGLKLDKKDNIIIRKSNTFKVRGAKEEELDAMIRQNPDYGKIVCRCETVSEAEIRQAIRQGARTVDGVKFRTRAGMGRCQAGFCTFRIMEILADELKLSPLEISKKGKGSELLVKNVVQNDEE